MKRIIFLILIIIFLSISILSFSTIEKKIIYPRRYDEIVTKYSKLYDIDRYLIFSVIKAESSFNPNSKSSKNAFGLMQITESTGRFISDMLKEDFEIAKLYDEETNIKYGVFYLSYLKVNFTSTNTMLAAYNAGEGNVKKWLNNDKLSNDGITLKEIPFKETEDYIKKIEKYYNKYKKLYE